MSTEAETAAPETRGFARFARNAEEARVSALAVEREVLEVSLSEFVRRAWHVVEPAEDYVHGWHVDALCEHLEALHRLEIRNLVINVPPRYMKSLSVCVFFPAWVWTREPSAQFLTTSYKQKFANRDAERMRRLVKSGWWQRRWGDLFRFRSTQDAKTHFENTAGGHRVTFGVGTGTGEGGDYVIVDDPHDVRKAESPGRRRDVRHWWDEVMSTRLNDPATGRKIIVMQRVHEDDLTAHVLQKGGWEHLMIPTEYEPDRHCRTSIGWEDPRSEPGELAWPERFPREAVEERKRSLKAYGASAQLQQRPTTREGGLFEADWFLPFTSRLEELPQDCIWCRYWDKAASEDPSASWTVGLLMGMSVTTEQVVVADVARDQLSAGPREDLIDDVADGDRRRLGGRNGFTVLVEQEGGAGGKESAESTRRRLERDGYNVVLDSPASRGNKFVRADPLSRAAEKGEVTVLDRPWAETFVRELARAGPGARNLDQMDAASGAYNWLSEQVVDFQVAAAAEEREGAETAAEPAEGRRGGGEGEEKTDRMFGGIPEDEMGGSWL